MVKLTGGSLRFPEIVGRCCHPHGMELMIIVVVLAAGVAIGWLLASQHANVRSRTGDVLRDAIGAEAADALEAVQAQLVSLERGRAGSEATLQEQVRAMAETSKQLRLET